MILLPHPPSRALPSLEAPDGCPQEHASVLGGAALSAAPLLSPVRCRAPPGCHFRGLCTGEAYGCLPASALSMKLKGIRTMSNGRNGSNTTEYGPSRPSFFMMPRAILTDPEVRNLNNRDYRLFLHCLVSAWHDDRPTSRDYSGCLRAVGRGPTTQKEIGEALGWDKTTLSKAMKTLISVGLLERASVRGAEYTRVANFAGWVTGNRYLGESGQPPEHVQLVQTEPQQPQEHTKQLEAEQEQPQAATGQLSAPLPVGIPASQAVGIGEPRDAGTVASAGEGPYECDTDRTTVSQVGCPSRETSPRKHIEKQHREQSSPPGSCCFSDSDSRQTATTNEGNTSSEPPRTPSEQAAIRALLKAGIDEPTAWAWLSQYGFGRILDAWRDTKGLSNNQQQDMATYLAQRADTEREASVRGVPERPAGPGAAAAPPAPATASDEAAVRRATAKMLSEQRAIVTGTLDALQGNCDLVGTSSEVTAVAIEMMKDDLPDLESPTRETGQRLAHWVKDDLAASEQAQAWLRQFIECSASQTLLEFVRRHGLAFLRALMTWDQTASPQKQRQAWDVCLYLAYIDRHPFASEHPELFESCVASDDSGARRLYGDGRAVLGALQPYFEVGCVLGGILPLKGDITKALKSLYPVKSDDDEVRFTCAWDQMPEQLGRYLQFGELEEWLAAEISVSAEPLLPTKTPKQTIGWYECKLKDIEGYGLTGDVEQIREKCQALREWRLVDEEEQREHLMPVLNEATRYGDGPLPWEEWNARAIPVRPKAVVAPV